MRYTLRTFCGNLPKESFSNRSPAHIRNILLEDRHHHPYETGPLGEQLTNVNRVEVLNNQNKKIFDGNVKEALSFIKTIK